MDLYSNTHLYSYDQAIGMIWFLGALVYLPPLILMAKLEWEEMEPTFHQTLVRWHLVHS
jgi:hypothetical protein